MSASITFTLYTIIRMGYPTSRPKKNRLVGSSENPANWRSFSSESFENPRFSKIPLSELSENSGFEKMVYPNHSIIQKVGVRSSVYQEVFNGKDRLNVWLEESFINFPWKRSDIEMEDLLWRQNTKEQQCRYAYFEWTEGPLCGVIARISASGSTW